MPGNQEESKANSVNAQGSLSRALSSENREIFVMPRQKSRSRERRESRMYLVDGQLCFSDDQPGLAGYSGGPGGSKRHSSVGFMFGSSMDLSGIGQSMDSSGGAGSGSEEAISYRIKWCRENIMQLKRQTWPMEKKLQVLRASKLFIKQHQGELAQSKQAKDVIASTSAIFERYWRHFKREFANFLVIITPWEMRIKKIESHFGSVVASYFTFLRWIFWLNLANSLVMCSFVMVPELIENVPDLTGMRKGELGMQRASPPTAPPPEFNPTLGEMWEFEGFLKFSPIFYGYYSNVEISRSGFWRNPLAFLLSAMITYLFCFFCISRKLSQNTKLSRIGSKDDEYTFCWTVFVGWDFMIGNSETAYNKTSSLVMNLKEGILEEKEQTKDRDWRLIIRRVFANVLTIMLIVASAYVVTLAVQRSENLPEDASLLQKNELQLVMSGIQFMFPPLFDVIGIIEKYHPRKALSWQLGRILFLDFLNFYTLMFSLFGTVDQMGNQLNEVSGNISLFRKNATYYNSLFTTTTTTTTTTLSPPSTTTINTTNATISKSINDISTLTSGSPYDDKTSASTMSLNVTESFNVSTILTSILLVTNNTEMPSNISVGSILLSTSATTDSSTTSNSFNVPHSSIELDLRITKTNHSPDLSVLSPTTFITRTTTDQIETTPFSVKILDASRRSQQSPIVPTSPKTNPDDEDYPDIGEVLKITSSGKQRLKRTLKLRKVKNKKQIISELYGGDDNEVIRFYEQESKDPGISDDSTKRTTSSIKNQAQHNSPRVYGAFIPQIQDPYQKTTGRTKWPIVIGGPADYEGDEEEPLEGRLIEPSKGVTVSTTTRKPSTWARTGVARPIGGKQYQGVQRGSRVQMTKAPSLNDDANEDLTIEPTDGPTTKGHEFNDFGNVGTGASKDPALKQQHPNAPVHVIFETTTTTVTTNQSSTGSNYSILIPEFTTFGTANELSSTNDSSELPETPVEDGAQGKWSLQSNGAVITETMGGETNENETNTVSCITQIEQTITTISSVILYPNGSSSVSNLKMSSFNASEVSYTDCLEIPDFNHQEILALNVTLKDKLKSLCWETMFGQEMVKIVVMDLVMTVISAVSFEFMRACFVRYCNRFFFWDLERGFPGYQDFKIAENVLHLVNNQSTVWMGMFFAPGLPAINTVKLAVLMYVRSWAVLTCNIPHETVFKVNKSNNFYYWILLINLLICILPVAYAVTWIRPSWHCGPFGGECRMYIVMTKLVKSLLPPEANSVFRYLTSPGAVIPILISLILIIYYLASTVSSSKEANKELKAQLKKDKEQEAAVPEITSTTVVDSAPTASNSSAIPAPAPSSTSVPTTIATHGSANNASINPNTLAPSMMPASRSPKEETTLAPADGRPGSLLMPPSH